MAGGPRGRVPLPQPDEGLQAPPHRVQEVCVVHQLLHSRCVLQRHHPQHPYQCF